jgi:IS1 family transposase
MKHSYIGSKKLLLDMDFRCIDIGERFLNFIIGDRGNQTAKEFWQRINQHEMKYIASDYWKFYESIIPREKHLCKQKQKLLQLRGIMVCSDIF